MVKAILILIALGVIVFMLNKVFPGITGGSVGGLAGNGASEALAGLGGLLRGIFTGLGRAFTG